MVYLTYLSTQSSLQSPGSASLCTSPKSFMSSALNILQLRYLHEYHSHLEQVCAKVAS